MIIADGDRETAIVGSDQVDHVPGIALNGQFLTFAGVGRLVLGNCKANSTSVRRIGRRAGFIGIWYIYGIYNRERND